MIVAHLFSLAFTSPVLFPILGADMSICSTYLLTIQAAYFAEAVCTLYSWQLKSHHIPAEHQDVKSLFALTLSH